ncbi:MAG TPA: MobF family relaxase [Solirubrobacteraceae bacterium]
MSIGKLSADQATYYLDQAEARADVVESVGGGIEEYYVGGREARGEWLGDGAAALRLAGGVDGDALREVLAGMGPDGEPLRKSRAPVRVAGFDLTFSAPKSVSVVFGLGEPAVQAQVRYAHDRAVREAIGYVERTAAAVRRGAGGARVEPADGLVAAAFRHRTSRAGDPQLHTHVLVANLGRGPDGRWSALDGRRLYAQARAASFVYQAVLRGELSRRLGVEWLTVRDGIAEIAGVPKPVLRAFSRRRAEIEAMLAERGTSSARAAEAAALATRRPKDTRTDIDALSTEWRARSEALGFSAPELAGVLSPRHRSRVLSSTNVERLFDDLTSANGLTRAAATFSRRDVVQALCERLAPTESRNAASLESLADRFLASPRVVPLLPTDDASESRVAFRRRDGRLLPVAREERTYSTPGHLALEHRLIDAALTSRDAGAGQATSASVEHAVATRPTLSDEQRAMVGRLCLSGDRVSVVVGKAGTGKTFALAAAREAWHASGRPVLGAAVARRAANQLQAAAGIAATSVTAILASFDREGLPAGAVVVVDEAGMVATRPLARLLDAVEKADGKLVLVGDDRQLSELEAGGAFRALARRGLAVELTENRRQREPWERKALDQLREGNPERAIEAYVAHDRIHIAHTHDEARDQLVRDWHATPTNEDAIMIAQTRADVADLNDRARALLRDAGVLGDVEVPLPGGDFAAGDLVLIKCNDARLGVTNGDRGRVLALDRAEERLIIEITGRAVTLDREFLTTPTAHGDPSLLHGYAMTCHVAQGMTVDISFVLADTFLTRELAYTALSRGRAANHLYLAGQPDNARAEFAPGPRTAVEPLERLVAGFNTSRARVLAIDAGHEDTSGRLAEARHELAKVRAERAHVGARRWSVGRKAKLRSARAREAAADGRVAELTREATEHRHASQPFLDERVLDQRAAATKDRIVERQLNRNHSRGLGL